MAEMYCSAKFKCGNDLDAALTAAMNCEENAGKAEEARIAAEAAREDAEAIIANHTHTAADVGAAPAGYGLGDTKGATFPINESGRRDFNLAIKNGLYNIDPTKGFDNGPDYSGSAVNLGYGVLKVERNRDIAQTVYLHSATGMYVLHRKNYATDDVDNWKPWEWDNPPMVLGVEYRTTERYLGKPVYAKVFDFGALPNNTEKQVNLNIVNLKHIVHCSAGYASGDMIPSYQSQTAPTRSVKINLVSQYNGGLVRIQSDHDASGASAYINLKYTKSTD